VAFAHASRIVLVLCSIVTAACDPDEDEIDQVIGQIAPTPTKADPAKDAADAAAKRLADGKKAAADHFAVCMAGCFEGKAQRSATDRQTCRLTCGAHELAAEGPAASTGIKAALGRFDTCLDADCRRHESTTDAATCRLTCAQAALAGEAAPPLAATARDCAVSCLEHTGDCEATCKHDGSPDDVATCRLQCLGLGERCLGRCEEDPSARAEHSETKPDGKAASAEAAKTEAVSVPKKTLKQLPAPQ
jgi:hypothetical protein